MVSRDKQLCVLIIMDGWGIGPAIKGNAITTAKLPYYNQLVKKYSHTALRASSKYVGLPPGQEGNSEAGHMNIGAGRIVEQDAVVISKSINNGTFFRNPAFMGAVAQTQKYHSDVHLVGMITGNQSAHSDPDHLISLITLFNRKKVRNIFLHLFTDGRDAPPYYAQKLFKSFHGIFSNYATVATVMGRFYGMDRKKEWSRTEMAYNTMVLGRGLKEPTPEDAVLHAYARGESDEFIKPTVIVAADNQPKGLIKNNDAVVFFNLRSDRARQLCKPFAQDDFLRANKGSFKPKNKPRNLFLVAMTDFGPDMPKLMTAYPGREIVDTLPMALSGYRQLVVAESEKFAHVTYFFNGGYDHPVNGEVREMIMSPDVKHYEDQPQMSLAQTSARVLSAIRNREFDFIVMNIANADMIAHTGKFWATVKACEYTDDALGKITKAVLDKKGICLITADHGNAEGVIDPKTGEPETEHSTNPVPFIIVKAGSRLKLRANGILGDIAPTVLDLLKLEQPHDMTGKSLIIH
ncbi:MAG: 2,3-bisphosphoglycerate-independent phosphoglycerate mutase [Candidatus Komeilibacteria bacterium]